MTNKNIQVNLKEERIKTLKGKIESLKDSLFLINMIDHWTRQDEELYDKYSDELKELQDLLIQEIVEK